MFFFTNLWSVVCERDADFLVRILNLVKVIAFLFSIVFFTMYLVCFGCNLHLVICSLQSFVDCRLCFVVLFSATRNLNFHLASPAMYFLFMTSTGRTQECSWDHSWNTIGRTGTVSSQTALVSRRTSWRRWLVRWGPGGIAVGWGGGCGV